MSDALLLFLLAGGAGAGGTLLVRGLAVRLGMVSHPNPIVPQHTRPVAYMGGVGVALGFAAGLAAAEALGPAVHGHPPRPALAAGAAAFLAIGVWDDLRPLRPWEKLLLQALAAAGAVTGGIVVGPTGVAALDAAVSALWIATVVNAVNLTDVCDGLVGGLALVVLLLLAAAAPHVRAPALAAAGATAGFLLFNLPPASIYLGDAGSHLLGFLLAALTLAEGSDFAPATAAPRAALLLGVFLFELVFLVVVRKRKGIRIWSGSPDHFSLRLQAAGLSRWQTDLTAWTVAAALGGAALLLPRMSATGQAVLAAAVLAGAALAGRALWRWEVPPRPAAAAVQGE